MSICMILAWGANSSTFPVALSSNRAPTAMTMSDVRYGHVRRIGAVHTEHAQELGVIAGEAAKAHERACDRDRQSLGKGRQLLCRVRRDDASPRIEYGLLRGCDELYGPLYLSGMAA